jgi:hypothetical protein
MQLDIEHRQLAQDLLQRAVDGTDEPARAASLLVSAAATILQRHFGVEAAIELMQQGLDEAGAAWRRAHAN